MEARTRSPVQLVGRQVRAQVIAAVVREPQLARHRVPGETDRVSEASCVDLDARSVRTHPKDGAVVALRAAHIARRADREVEKAVWPEFQHLPAVMPVGRQPVGDDHGSRRGVQSRFDVVETEDGADGCHVEGSVVERDPARHPESRCDLAHALATTVAVFIGHREHAPFPAGADEEGAFLAPGHLPCIGDFREVLDDEALREMDGGEAIVLLCRGGDEESNAEQQGQDDGSHDLTHIWGSRRLSQCTEASRRCSGTIPAQGRSMQTLAGGLVPHSTVVRRVRADEDLPSARRRSDPTDDPWPLYRRAASTMIQPRPRRSK